MGNFTFKWQQPAEEVYVTGTFDDWGKTVRLEKKGSIFIKDVELPATEQKIHYKTDGFSTLGHVHHVRASSSVPSIPKFLLAVAKSGLNPSALSTDEYHHQLVDLHTDIFHFKFVVDGTWTVDQTAPHETDGQNNLNNVLTPEYIAQQGSAIMSSTTPQSTTAALAAGVPKEPSGMPGHFPETPQHEPKEFTGSDMPPPSTAASATNKATPGEEAQSFGVNPIPASAGMGNPVQLKPGEKVPDPSTFTASTVNSTVTTDRESYERGGSASLGAPVLPDVVTPESERGQKGTGVLDIPPITNTMIPESSLPMGGQSSNEKDPGVTISSAAPTSDTAKLAGQVPLERRNVSAVPEVVKESQEAAHVDPEASGSTDALKDKKAMETELKREVPEEPAAAQGTSTEGDAGRGTPSKGSGSGGILGGMAGGVASAATTAKDKVTSSTGSGPSSNESRLPESIMRSINQMNLGSDQKGTGVPAVVSQSIEQAHESPEAAANKEAVREKGVVERELLKEVKPEESAGQPAPTARSAALTDSAPGVTASQGDGLAGGAPAPAMTPATKSTQHAAETQQVGSATKTSQSSQPVVTTGVAEAPTTATSTPPQVPAKDAAREGSPAPGSTGEVSGKKERRRSGFFGSRQASSEVPATGSGETSKEEKRKSGFFR
ncbi:MAG: hypothetical protein M1817_004341, partial [Caeruleum heppii]